VGDLQMIAGVRQQLLFFVRLGLLLFFSPAFLGFFLSSPSPRRWEQRASRGGMIISHDAITNSRSEAEAEAKTEAGSKKQEAKAKAKACHNELSIRSRRNRSWKQEQEAEANAKSKSR
jgi:hypothetical protein